MRHQKIARAVERQTVWPGPARQLDIQAHPGERAIRQKHRPPDTVAARDRQKQQRARGIEHNPVGTGDVVEQAFKRPLRALAKDAPGWVLQPRLPLVGEIERTACIKEKVVQAFEAFGTVALQKGRDRAGCRIDPQQPEFVVGDDQLPLRVDLESVRLAVIFGHQVDLAVRADAKNPAECNVHQIQVASLVERRPLDETVGEQGALASGQAFLAKASCLAIAVRNPGEDFGAQYRGRSKHGRGFKSVLQYPAAAHAAARRRCPCRRWRLRRCDVAALLSRPGRAHIR